MSSSSLVRRVPKYSKHKASGRAYARFDGRCIYFGRYGTAGSREAYNRLKTEWLNNGGQLPAPPHEATITEVVVAYTEFATGYYRKGDLSCHRAFIREAHDLCDENRDVASARLIEVWIDESERRTWFLFEASQREMTGGH